MVWKEPLSTVRLLEAALPSKTTESSSAMVVSASTAEAVLSMFRPHWLPEVARPSVRRSASLTTAAYQRQPAISTSSRDTVPAPMMLRPCLAAPAPSKFTFRSVTSALLTMFTRLGPPPLSPVTEKVSALEEMVKPLPSRVRSLSSVRAPWLFARPEASSSTLCSRRITAPGWAADTAAARVGYWVPPMAAWKPPSGTAALPLLP